MEPALNVNETVSRKIGTIDRIFSWWIGELWATLRVFAPRRSRPRPPDAVIFPTENHVRIEHFKHRKEIQRDTLPLGSAANLCNELEMILTSSGRVRLRLAEDQALVHVLEFPASAEANLYNILKLQIARLTPFRPDQSYFDYDVVERRASEGTIEVCLGIATKELVDGLLAQLETWGVRATQVDIAGEDGKPSCDIDLLRKHEPAGSPRIQRFNSFLLATSIVLFVGLLGLPFVELYLKENSLVQQAETVKTEMRYLTALRNKTEAIEKANLFLDEKRQKHVPTLQIVRELSLVLADDTWLDKLLIADGEVLLRGRSRNAAELIGVIEGSPLFTGTAFRGSITQVESSPHERFQVVTELQNPGEEENGQ